MVGYEANETLTPNQKLIAGCISGGLTRFITQPLDIIKLRTQLEKKKVTNNKRFFRTTKTILKEEGVSAFWHGHNLGQNTTKSLKSISYKTKFNHYNVIKKVQNESWLKSLLRHFLLQWSHCAFWLAFIIQLGTVTTLFSLKTTTQFYVYELTTRYVLNTFNPKNKTFFLFLCGIFAGCCAATVVIPLEVIRVRQMLVKAQYGGLLQGARQVYSTGGLLAFYEGLGASLLQMGPSVGISFAVFRFAQPLLLGYISPGCKGTDCERFSSGNMHKPGDVLIASTLAGSLAGFMSKSFTYPFDLAKRRLQISSHVEDPSIKQPKNLIKCHNLMDCLTKTVQKEGVMGLFRGWTVTMYKAQLTSVVAFSCYEMICHALRDHQYPPEGKGSK